MTGCKYMLWLEKSLGSLKLALAAYNCGIGRVRTEISKGLEPSDSAVIGGLPEETREYVEKCLDFEGETLRA